MINLCKLCNKSFISRRKSQVFCSLLCSNRFNLNNKKKVTLPLKHNSELAELVGILLGDGSVEKYYTRIYLNLIADQGYEINVIKLIKNIFPKITLCVMERPKRGTREIQISSKEISDYLFKIGFKPKIREVPSWIRKNNSYTRCAVRGLFDTEGSVGIKYFKGKKGICAYKQLTFTNKNKNLLSFIEESLRKFQFSPTKNSKKNIYLSNKKDIERYFEVIGTNNPKLEKKMKMK